MKINMSPDTAKYSRESTASWVENDCVTQQCICLIKEFLLVSLGHRESGSSQGFRTREKDGVRKEVIWELKLGNFILTPRKGSKYHSSQQGRVMVKGAFHQVWQPEADPWDPRGGKNTVTPKVVLWPHVGCGMHTHIHTYSRPCKINECHKKLSKFVWGSREWMH